MIDPLATDQEKRCKYARLNAQRGRGIACTSSPLMLRNRSVRQQPTSKMRRDKRGPPVRFRCLPLRQERSTGKPLSSATAVLLSGLSREQCLRLPT
jgi:hypothetical protein